MFKSPLFKRIFLLTTTIVSLSSNIFAQTPKIKIGGTLRFNYRLNEINKNKGGDILYDMFAIKANGTYGKAYISAEYRLYPNSSGGGMLRYGFLGYNFSKHHDLQIGQTLVNFGAQPCGGNSFYLNQTYYLGLEDDYDLGIKYTFTKKGVTLAAGFFKDAELGNGNRRYSFDASGDFREQNTGNLFLSYNWGKDIQHEIGVSGKLGELNFNNDTVHHNGTRSAFALHYKANIKNFCLRTQYTYYNFRVNGTDGKRCTYFTTGAYNGNYITATKAQTYTAALSYDIKYGKDKRETIRLYNDFNYMHKSEKDFQRSIQNIAGIMVQYGPIYSYLEYIGTQNHAFFKGDFAQGNKKWDNTFNLNIGYYF